jgi:hypothetical protein
MSIVEPDFSEALDMSPIDEGTYPARLIAGKMTMSKGGPGKESVPLFEAVVQLNVSGKNRERNVYLVTKGKGAGGFQQLLRAVGRDDLAGGGVAFDTDELLNIDFFAVVTKQQEGQYAGRDQVTSFLKA